MLKSSNVLDELESLYCTSIDIELFGVTSFTDLDEVIDMEIETWADLDKPISEIERLAQKAIGTYILTMDDPDRLQEYICRKKTIDFLTEMNSILEKLKIRIN
ncbi:hypothetical protein [Nonlabens ponticola]|uniref:Uncharacterized protein n=1 Tax=Nonlabens ponticola TaxID=2496866 RepID=A0A3S9N0I5_9FLAO|nr:hypothetical protein [Nonlabens ponticola]AZQ44823.1 hypothetical protein EJ995_11490 [Nonlabens ponticola]